MRARFPGVRPTWPLLVAVLLAASALAQEPATSSTEDVHERMRKLIVQIEQGLKLVDQLLWNAEAGPASEGAPISARLNESRVRASKVVEDIDRLLDIRHHPHGSGGS